MTLKNLLNEVNLSINKLEEILGPSRFDRDQSVDNKDMIKDKKNFISFKDILKKYSDSDNYGNSFTFTQENFNQFKLTTIKNVTKDGLNVGYLAITENANDIKTAIDERKAFVVRTAIAVGFVILIFS